MTAEFTDSTSDAVHLRGEVNHVSVAGFAVDPEVMQDYMFPPSETVTYWIADVEQASGGTLLGETGHLLDEAEECFDHTRTPPLRSTSSVASTRRRLRIQYGRDKLIQGYTTVDLDLGWTTVYEDLTERAVRLKALENDFDEG